MPEHHEPEQDLTVRTKQGETLSFDQHATLACPQCGLRVTTTTRSCPQDGTLIGPEMGGLNENYELLDLIGRGGMSVIYKARHRALNLYVAVKMLHGHLENPEIVMRFQQEAKAVSILHHTNIVAVRDFGVSEHGQPYMIMDFVDGKNLADILKELGELPVSQCLDIFLEISSALAHAHDRRILHRDLKPSNIMLTITEESPCTVRIVDFGIAKIMGSDDGAQGLTQTGELFGSPLYMSPEQCGGKKVDLRSDVYSFGCMMYECLTGTVPLRGQTVMDTITKHLHEQPVLISKLRPDKEFPPKLEDIVDKALSKNQEQRYQSMHELRADLLKVQDELESGRWSGSSRTLMRLLRGNGPKVVVGLVAALVVGSALLVLIPHLFKQPEAEIKTPKVSIDQYEAARRNAKMLELVPREKITNRILSDALSIDAGLESLNLNGASQVDDLGMDGVAQQSRLRQLYLDGTKIGDGGLKRLRNLQNIDDLTLRRTHIGSAGLAYLAGMSKLKTLSLSGSYVDDEAVKNLMPFKNLRYVSFSSTGIKGTYLDLLKELPELHTLHFAHTVVSVPNLAKLEGCNKLTELELDNMGTIDDAVKAIVPLKSLEVLNLDANNLTDISTKYLTELPHLRELEMEWCHITDAGAENLAKIKTLRKLELSHTLVTDHGVKHLSQLSNLEVLELGGCPITDTGAKAISQMTQLTGISLHKTLITDTGLSSLAGLPNLRWLNVGDCTGLSPKALEEFARTHRGCRVTKGE